MDPSRISETPPYIQTPSSFMTWLEPVGDRLPGALRGSRVRKTKIGKVSVRIPAWVKGLILPEQRSSQAQAPHA